MDKKWEEVNQNPLNVKIYKALKLFKSTLGLQDFIVYIQGENHLFYQLSLKDGNRIHGFKKSDIAGLSSQQLVRFIEIENQVRAIIKYDINQETDKDRIQQINDCIDYLKDILNEELENLELGQENNYHQNLLQLYRGLNRQFDKDQAIRIVVDFIHKKLGYQVLYLDIQEENKMTFLKYISDDKGWPLQPTILNLNLSIDIYRQILHIKNEEEIVNKFPSFKSIFNPKEILSTPVYSQNKLVGLLILYHGGEKEMGKEVKYFTRLISKELTAVFSRIEQHNLRFEKVLGLTALESILLYNAEEDTSANEILEKIIAIIPNATGMKKCTIALLDETGTWLLPHYSNFDVKAKNQGRKYPLDKRLTKDHTGIIALESKSPVVVYDAMTDPRCDHGLSKELGVYSNVILPILDVHGNPLGVIYLDNGEYQTFSKRQIRFFEIIARHLGLIISNIEYIGDLKIRSKYDGLTGLLNRRTFEGLYDEIYESYRFGKGQFSILMLDIDNFKETNDNYGHQLGDLILKKVAKNIKENVRKKDIVARYGGEEIIILLKDINQSEAKVIAERIRDSIANLSVNGIGVTVSIGISTYRTDSFNKDKLIDIADRCLYVAKNTGKNQVKCRQINHS